MVISASFLLQSCTSQESGGDYSSHRFVGKATGAAELAQVLMEVKEKYGEELFNGAEVEVDVQDYLGDEE